MIFGVIDFRDGSVKTSPPVPAPTVVMFTTYPVARPRSGGQIRARALLESYRSQGFKPISVAVSPRGAFPRSEMGRYDLTFPPEHPQCFENGERLPSSEDVQAGQFAAANDALFRKLVKQLPSRVDVFHLEQPFLWPVVKRLRQMARFQKAKVVYGSQNIEAPLREATCRLEGSDPTRVVQVIRSLETEMARMADVVLAVSASDQAGLIEMGAPSVVMATNGIHGWTSSAQGEEKWRSRVDHRNVILFVGSAHPPNAVGFVRAMGDSLGFVPPNGCIVIGGAVSRRISEHYRSTRYASLNLSRLYFADELTTRDLSALKAISSAFVLPIFEGGGSNIKTSEALYSGKPVIATSVSLRGFDRYLHFPELVVADSTETFTAAVHTAFQNPPRPIRADPTRDSLLWENTLKAVPQAVRALLS